MGGKYLKNDEVKNLIMKKAILTIGPSGCGKSFWAKEFVKNNNGYVIIERDLIRFSNFEDLQWSSYKFTKENEQAVNKEYDAQIELAVERGKNIICADTNLNPQYRGNLISKLEGLGFEVELKVFHVSYEKCVENDVNRCRSVGSSVIARQFEAYLTYLRKSNDPFVKRLANTCGYKTYSQLAQDDKNGVPILPKAIICDIDGTLADMADLRGPFDWKKVGKDKPHHEIIELVGLYQKSRQDFKVIIFSGRDEVCRDETIMWLLNHGVDFDELYMRPNKSQISDVELKYNLFNEHIRDKYNVHVVIDDRPKVCRMWREIGLKVLQVGNPHLEF